MKALKIALLVVGATIGLSSCIVPVPVGGGPRYHGGPVYRGGGGYRGGGSYHGGPRYHRGGGGYHRHDRGPRRYR